MRNKITILFTFVLGVSIALLGVYIYGMFFSFKKDIKKLEQAYRSLKSEYNDFKKKYKSLEEENIFLNAEKKKLKRDMKEITKKSSLLEEENKDLRFKLLKANDAIEKLKDRNKRLAEDVNDKIKKILAERKSLTDEIDFLKSQVQDYKKKVEIQQSLPNDIIELKSRFLALESEKKKLEEKSASCSTQLVVLAEKARRLEIENDTYRDTISKTNNLIEVLQKERNQYKEKYEKAQVDLDTAKKTIIELTNENKQLKSENKSLSERVARLPTSMAELAQLKKQLKKEKTLFYYNMGVFYTQKGEYKKAVENFNKVIAINPQDADAHYNLGVIYSEYLDDKEKAIQHFNIYLRLAPTDAYADKARKYLLLQKAIEGRK